MDKADLRKKAKEIRRRLGIQTLSRNAVDKIRNMPDFESAENVLLYYPLADELNFLSLCNCDKNFYLPRIEGDKLLVCPYTCGCELKKSEFKTLEPCSAPVKPKVIDFAIIPCLMADKHGYRLGYGGGFYDRFIPSLREDCVKITVVPQELFVEDLPVEKFDCRVDKIVVLPTPA